jgi:hypothetical protein
MTYQMRGYSATFSGFTFKWWPYIGRGRYINVFHGSELGPVAAISVWDFQRDRTTITSYDEFMRKCVEYVQSEKRSGNA